MPKNGGSISGSLPEKKDSEIEGRLGAEVFFYRIGRHVGLYRRFGFGDVRQSHRVDQAVYTYSSQVS
jgi:hypothetical protein